MSAGGLRVGSYKPLKSLRRAGFWICGPVTCKSLKLLRLGLWRAGAYIPLRGIYIPPTPLGGFGEVYPR
jgi:hypothetical protein